LTYIPELGFKIPTNLQVCLEKIKEISNVNIFPEQWSEVIKGYFNFKNDNEKKKGFTENIGQFLLIIIAVCSALIFLLLLFFLSKRFEM
jgi:hypothetical protein